MPPETSYKITVKPLFFIYQSSITFFVSIFLPLQILRYSTFLSYISLIASLDVTGYHPNYVTSRVSYTTYFFILIKSHHFINDNFANFQKKGVFRRYPPNRVSWSSYGYYNIFMSSLRPHPSWVSIITRTFSISSSNMSKTGKNHENPLYPL
jgi:hypothetical protein